MHNKKVHADHDLEKHDLLKNYSEHSYRINDQLYDHHVNGDALPDKDHIQTLDQLINKDAKYDFKVYTGLKWNPEHYGTRLDVAIDHEIIMHLPAFTSATTKKEVAFHFCRSLDAVDSDREIKFKNKSIERHYKRNFEDWFYHVLEIEVKSGVTVGSLKSQSKFPEEEEIVIKRGVNTKILPTVELDYDTDGNFVFIWKAEILL